MASDVQIREGRVKDDEIRLYICQDCKQIIPIPSDGVPPYRYDYLLHKLEAEHGGPTEEWVRREIGDKYTGLPPVGRGHAAAVIAVTQAAWETEKGQQKILQQIKNAVAGGETGLGSEFYDVKDQFHEDAIQCWRAHNRTLNCHDFKTKKKELKPDTAALRRAEGMGEYRSNIHLCNFCPVANHVEQKLRANKVDKGMY